VATLALDGLSFIAFEGFENLSLPGGSAIRFRFDRSNADGSASFTIEPGDVTIPPIALGDDMTLEYGLASTASGILRKGETRREIQFQAIVQVRLRSAEGESASSYAVSFTTQEATATNAARTRTVEVEGASLVPGPNYVQLVGAATNRSDAIPGPGAAVYAVLSGSFDWIPEAR
jgi:hypothetical protein